ncbi:rho guanine nucleotide exchange factor 12 [Aplochiton taeniatus]
MSGTQLTLTDRFPIKKATRTASILSKDHPPDKKPKSDKSPVSLTNEFDPTGLVQRCVIIQKDDNGFGLTVSGDNPVFVQLVKEDGAALRAGVQTGDRIIKVNGTLVTHSNHVEVVKLIKSGSYVALTVLGRPPGLAQIPLGESEVEGEPSLSSSSLSSPLHSPGPTGGERSSSITSSVSSPQDHITSPLPVWEENNAVHSQKVDILQKMLTKEQQDLQVMKEEYSRNPTAKLLKEIQEAKKHIPLLQGQLSKAMGTPQDGPVFPRDGEMEEGGLGLLDGDHSPSFWGETGIDAPWTNSTVLQSHFSESPSQRVISCHSPKTHPRENFNSCTSPDTEDTPDLDTPSSVISPSPRLNPQIIGAEDDYFDTEQDQINGQCSCFQSVELLKSRPAHLAAFLHHVVSQFDPAPLLCYLHADLYKQTNSKETRRIFMDFHTFFMDRSANLKVAVPETIAAELERRRPELIPEDLHRQYVQLLQDTLLPDIQRNLEDFRQKRSMGLTLAEGELSKLDTERVRDRVALEKERSCAEHILSKIEDVLLTSQATEEEKCTTMQYVILSYMKHLGVKVKEPRCLEPKRVRINFLPKIKKSIKPEKEGEEKVKKPRFPSILGQPRRPSRVDSTSISKAMELTKTKPQKITQPALSVPEHPESFRARGSQSIDNSDGGAHPSAHVTSPPFSAPAGHASDPTGRDSDTGLTPSSAMPRLFEGVHSGDAQDGTTQPNSSHFDFSPCTLDHLQEEDRESDRVQEGGTPKPSRRMDGVSSAGLGEVQSEDDQGNEIECEQDPPNWQQLVSRDVLLGLTPQEIKRQEVINELFYTERAHLRMVRVLDYVFYQKLSREGILPAGDIKNIFTNLEEIVQLHVSITEQMTAIRKKSETSVIGPIGDDLLAWFSGPEEEKVKRAVGTFCSNQPFALELIKSRQKKDQRFTSFMLEAESNRLCRRLQLKDIIPVEMQRLTKYPLLLESIAKCTEDTEEKEKVKRAGECCRKILNHVNQAVKEAENKQRLEDYQRRLDLSSLKQSENPMIAEFKNLDLTKRKMVHEGPLSWKVNKDKTIELYTLLLEDILVLLQKQDERLILKCHSKNLAGTADTKHIFSPIIKLNTVLVRSVATDNKSFFVLSMSDNGAQIYELMAQTVSEQRTWQCLITQRADPMKTKPHIPIPQTDGERDAVEIINTEVPKLGKDHDRTLTEGLPSPEKDATTAPVLPSSGTSTNPFEGIKSEEEEEDEEEEEEEEALPPERGEEEVNEEEAEEIGAFLESELAERLPFLQERSRQGIAIKDQEPEHIDLFPSRAEEALRTLAALKQVLLHHMASREAGDQGMEREPNKSRASGTRLLRTTSLRGPEEENGGESNSSSSRTAGPPAGSQENGATEEGREAAREGGPLELPSGDTGFFETSEDCGSYMVLDGYGGSGESSTDDGGGGGGFGGDSGIDLKKLLSSSSQAGGAGPNLSRQVMTHLRLLQANLQHLKEVEMKYNQLRHKLSETATDAEESQEDMGNVLGVSRQGPPKTMAIRRNLPFHDSVFSRTVSTVNAARSKRKLADENRPESCSNSLAEQECPPAPLTHAVRYEMINDLGASAKPYTHCHPESSRIIRIVCQHSWRELSHDRVIAGAVRLKLSASNTLAQNQHSPRALSGGLFAAMVLSTHSVAVRGAFAPQGKPP